jgi:hypothetical protein
MEAAMTDAAGEASEPPKGGRLEVVVAVILSIGGLSTSWAGYQGALWDGQQAEYYTRAGELRTTTSRAWLEIDTWRSNERALFGSWLEATLTREPKLAEFYKSRFPPDMKPAFEAWIALSPFTNPQAPPGPLFMPQYRPQGTTDAERLERQTEAATRMGRNANDLSDRFTQGGLFMATSMFFAGFCQVFKISRVRVFMLTIAVICCAGGLLRLCTLPMLRPG